MMRIGKNQLPKEIQMKKYVAVTGLLASSLLGTQAFGAEREGPTRDAWIDGKLEGVYLLNRHLNSFAIDTEVENGVVHLTGKVESDIDRDLAGEIAKGIDGVVDVDNDLTIAAGSRVTHKPGEDRTFGVWVDDATTTAAVKAKLLGNPNTKGTKIDVDTRGDVVTLSGQVASAEEKSLAEELAQNTGDVQEVRNRLVVQRAN
jgi:osmotically-inducible protein OsmY